MSQRSFLRDHIVYMVLPFCPIHFFRPWTSASQAGGWEQSSGGSAQRRFWQQLRLVNGVGNSELVVFTFPLEWGAKDLYVAATENLPTT